MFTCELRLSCWRIVDMLQPVKTHAMRHQRYGITGQSCDAKGGWSSNFIAARKGNRLSVAAWQAVKDKLKQRCVPDPDNKNRLPVCCYDPDGVSAFCCVSACSTKKPVISTLFFALSVLSFLSRVSLLFCVNTFSCSRYYRSCISVFLLYSLLYLFSSLSSLSFPISIFLHLNRNRGRATSRGLA
jgi:hypothetical protein